MLQPYDERNRDILVNINGELVHRDKAGVSPFDSSVQNGDAVWEGLRLYDGRIFRLEQHLARLRKSAAALAYQGFPDDDAIINELTRTLKANDMTGGVHVRLTVSRGVKYTSGLDPRINTKGCSLFILAEHKPPVYEKTGVRLKTAAHRRPPSDVLDQTIHSCNQLTSILAKLEANAAGADDALMLDTRGFIAETNATHVFFVMHGAVHTPTTGACPEGVTRAAVIDICRDADIACHIRDITLAEAYRADEALCTGTMGEIASITEIDGREIPTGDVTERIARRFAELTRTEGTTLV